MVMIVAHRGAHEIARENTVEAFGDARRLGADGVELDVRLSADGAMVVHHDAAIAGSGPIASLRVVDLPAYVPLLDAAIEACGDLIVNVELKDLPGEPGYDQTYPLACMVARFVTDRRLVEQVVLSSFDLRALDAARTVEPALETGWLTLSSFDQALALETIHQRGHRRLHPRYEAVTQTLVAAAHDAGIGVTAWTADDPVTIGWLAAAGVDAIVTNVVDVARATLAR